MRFEIPKEIKREIGKKGGWEKIKSILSKDDLKKIERVMKALSDERRLKILYLLYNQRACPCMISDVTNCSFSKCSYHISKLKEAGLIKAIKKGNYIVYSLTKFGRSIVRHFNKYKPEGGGMK